MPTAAASVVETAAPEPAAKKRASPPKNCPCEWCGVLFSKSGLGRHYDYWVYSVSPGKPDEKHTNEAIQRMREIRKDARRLKGCDKLDPKEVSSRIPSHPILECLSRLRQWHNTDQIPPKQKKLSTSQGQARCEEACQEDVRDGQEHGSEGDCYGDFSGVSCPFFS